MKVPGPTRKKIVDSRVAKLLDERRFYYVIPESGYAEGKGFRVSIAIEHESGHFPTGNTPEGGDIEPWYCDGCCYGKLDGTRPDDVSYVAEDGSR